MATIRLGGLASGIDTDSVVKELMSARRQPLTKLNQQKIKLEWQQELYREINIKLVDLRNNKLSNYRMNSTLNTLASTVTGNTSAVTTKATSSAVSGSMSIEVHSLATAASRVSTTGIGTNVDTNKSLAELGLAASADATISFTINDSETITVSGSDKLSDVISKINSTSGANVAAYFDSASGKLSLTSKTTGDASTVSIGGTNADFFDQFNLGAVVPGDDADVTINGIRTNRASNTFTENGVQITLNAASNGVASTVTTKMDTSKFVELVKSYITAYNDILDTINSKINEKKSYSYAPLTEEQKEEMTEEEIELWEKKAKQGLLRNDTVLSTLVNNMRIGTISDVEIGGEKVNITSLGITTGEWGERGKLKLDENALIAALEEDPEKVIAFFSQETTETDPVKAKSATNPDSGLFNRMYNELMTALDSLAEKAGTSRFSTSTTEAFNPSSLIGTQILDIDRRIARLEDRLLDIENNYYKQFAAMESAINSMNAQSSSLFG
ncbi:flagellar filament capping protein FliD [Cohnella massiliensis]|uniref:flagellar filament capping protein FliD n=1 Tax=Cohnella massiliensis TaxID=1816691 RepID=UPI0009B93660|nr:flagellar filament capping protein FliD [Cohnella massiliensis]